jgi:LPXTG-motif cell wall-anchored protein
VETDYYAYCVDVENSDAPEVVYFDGATDGPFVIRHSTGGEIETLSFVKQSPPPTTTSTTSTTVPETTTTTVPETTTTTVPETTTTTVPGTTSTVPTTDTTPTTQPGITTTTIRTEHPRTGSDHAVPMTAIGLGLILVGTTILVSRAKRRVASV